MTDRGREKKAKKLCEKSSLLAKDRETEGRSTKSVRYSFIRATDTETEGQVGFFWPKS